MMMKMKEERANGEWTERSNQINVLCERERERERGDGRKEREEE
jgi:hypothetical protein